MKTLTLIVPEVEGWPATRSEGGTPWPTLARLAGRGSVSIVASTPMLRPWQRACIASAGLASAEAAFASAAVSWQSAAEAAAGASDAAGIWMQAEPAHLAAGLDTLRFLRLAGAARATGEELAALAAAIGPHLEANDLTLHVLAEGTWVVHWPRGSMVDLTWPEEVTDVAAALPQGADATMLRRLMTELQMVLHDHDVNRRRERRQLPPINAVWFCGGGPMRVVAPRAGLPRAFGVEPFLVGLYRAHGDVVGVVPPDADALLEQCVTAQDALAVISPITLDDLERHWVAPLARAMRSARVSRVDIVAGSRSLSVDRGALRRFWRRPLAPGEWRA